MRKLAAAEKAAKALRKAQFMFIFINGRQKRVRRPALIEGQSVEDFIASNADPLWLHQNEMWEYLSQDERGGSDATADEDHGIPFQYPGLGVF
jgi:hypothetical protein